MQFHSQANYVFLNHLLFLMHTDALVTHLYFNLYSLMTWITFYHWGTKRKWECLTYYFRNMIYSFLICEKNKNTFSIILEICYAPFSYVICYPNSFISLLKVLLDFCIIPSTGDKSCRDYHVSLSYHECFWY